MEETYYKDTKFSKTQTDSTPQADLLFEWPSSHEPQNQVKVDDLPPPKVSSPPGQDEFEDGHCDIVTCDDDVVTVTKSDEKVSRVNFGMRHIIFNHFSTRNLKIHVILCLDVTCDEDIVTVTKSDEKVSLKSSSWRIPNLLKKWPFHTETVEEMQKRVDEELRIFNEEIQASIALKKVTTAAEIKNIKRESARRIVQTEDNSKQEAFNFVMKYSTLEEIKRYNDAQGSRDYAEITRNDVIKRSRESTKI
ncbi:hypothetical protein Fcan01_23124 [Folsomia candida]|uniref:Uncharacterized protein n=1 Tax=Folsomia candida TaxID=158441 RepID=A0A226D8W5_FOLCA|nr:hypothetical protein Fcan01_23124 [Folsomia candida]